MERSHRRRPVDATIAEIEAAVAQGGAGLAQARKLLATLLLQLTVEDLALNAVNAAISGRIVGDNQAAPPPADPFSRRRD